MIMCTEPRAPMESSPSIAPSSTADIEKLPPELVTAMLEFLDQEDLRRAAAVSRLWYASAWSAGLSLSARIVCNRFYPGSQPAMLDEAVQHALRTNRRLSLSLTLIAFDNTDWSAFKAVVSSVASSLPALVYLWVSVSGSAVPSFVSALCQPAPHLREFLLFLEQGTRSCELDVPGDIFGGVAPKLRRLVLDRVPLGQPAVPAFSQVTILHMECFYHLSDIDYAEHFPRLLDLHLAFHTPPGSPPPASLRFGGLRLHRLVIEDSHFCPIIPATIRSMDLSRIPIVEHLSTKLHPGDPLWKQDLGAISIFLRRHIQYLAGVSMLVVPAHRRWRRAYQIHMHDRDEDCPISALPGLLRVDQCLTYLRIDGAHIVTLLEACWPDLAALRMLRVDCHGYGTHAPVTWPPPRFKAWCRAVSVPERRRYVRCPALETLTLSACDATMTLASRDVALLGGALAQCERDAQERAALILVGIELTEPEDDALLWQTFSSIRSRAFSGAGSPWHRDGGLWDEDL